MEVRDVPIGSIRPYDNNPRDNSAAVGAVTESIERFGWQQPIVVDRDGVIVVGHTRYEAARRLGLETVPVKVADGLSPEKVRAYRLADNKVGELATWDDGKLEAELDALGDELDGLDFDMSDFGFGHDGAEPKNMKPSTREWSHEIDLDEFSDERFDHACPKCGFRFND